MTLTNPIAAVEADSPPATIDAGGIALGLHAGHFLDSEMVAARWAGLIANMLSPGLPVALSIGGIAGGGGAREAMYSVCAALANALQRAGVGAGNLEIGANVNAIEPRLLWGLRRQLLGPGTVNLLLDEVSMFGASLTDLARWRQAWELRESRVVLACCPAVTSCCPLLAPEPATRVIPVHGMQAPPQSAWLICTLDLPRFANAAGVLDTDRIDAALERYVETAESQHDVATWPTPRMQHDSWLNRRVAIRIAGIGDIAAMRGLDPTAHSSVVELDAVLRRIRCTAERCSRRIAKTRETLPAIAATNPSRRLGGTAAQRAWEARWLRAIDKVALGHRNLIVMSPWSVFPGARADYRYSNLLPLLAHADACEFARTISVDRWTLADYANFHRRVWAVRRNAEAAMAVAKEL